jgi:uncharacterized protein
MHEQDHLYEDFDTDPSNRNNIPRRKVTPGDFAPQPFRWRLWLIAALVAILLVVWPTWAGFYTDWLWFQEVGYKTVFSTILTTKVLAGLAAGFVAALLFWLSLQIALRVSGAANVSGYKFQFGDQEIAMADAGKIIARLAVPISLVIGIFFGLQGWGVWDEFLLFRHGVAFGENDPVLGYDISFYFFKLPFLDFISGALVTLLVLAAIAAVVVYLGRAAIGIRMGGDEAKPGIWVTSGARTHLLVLGAILAALLAARYYLDLPALLFGTSGSVSGAGYTDINATVPLLWAKIAVLLLVALAAIASIFLKGLRLIAVGITLFVLVTIAGVLYPMFVQRFSVAPNELQKESPFIEYSIAATRKAYNLNTVEERELTGASTLTAKDIQDNRRTINGIRLWDQGPLLSTFAQLQEIRPYYGFLNVDNDRYKINGEEQQVMLSVRELESEKLPNRNWINERLIFTHGYGVTLGPVHQVTPSGLPVLFIENIPPKSSIPDLQITRPEIYYGEMTNEQVYVRTKQQEFNYPEGEKNQFTTYAGTGGVPIGSYFRKLMFSTRFGELKLMLSDDITAESRVLFHRNIKERLSKIAPFLTLDRDPYMVISGGKCYWLCDAYTTSNRYPYSQRTRIENQPLNYIRNSVKAVIDAYDGSVQLYMADERDPVLQTYARIFPGILKPLKEMPADLLAHLRYPEDIFRIQTQVYATYHMDQPQVFYNKEDQWEIASASEQDGQPNLMEPYYTIMKLPNAPSEEFLVMLPFVPKNKQNLAAWMVARCDPENYGQMVVYRIPKQKQIFGPKQIIGRINQDAEISGQLTLWGQRGSKAVFGTMLVIPIKESLLYVQPLYLQAETGKIPELKRVIVAYGDDRIAMGETLEQSLNKLFGNSATATQPPAETLASTAQPPSQTQSATSTATSTLAAQALQQYDRAEQALREGNWAKYGEELKRLRATLEEISKGK